jgi:hypothetical protein
VAACKAQIWISIFVKSQRTALFRGMGLRRNGAMHEVHQPKIQAISTKDKPVNS